MALSKIMFRALSSNVKIYTRTGDKGTTFLNAQTGRLPKYSEVFQVLGDTDELSCSLSIAKEHCGFNTDVSGTLTDIQHRLQDINSHLATNYSTELSFDAEIKDLEARIDQLTGHLDPLRNFIIPSGGLAASHLHFARAVCRRVERSLCLFLAGEKEADPMALAYVNRLSDYLFTAARYCSNIQGHPETTYSSRHRNK